VCRHVPTRRVWGTWLRHVGAGAALRGLKMRKYVVEMQQEGGAWWRCRGEAKQMEIDARDWRCGRGGRCECAKA
jgi:hypothetical protein